MKVLALPLDIIKGVETGGCPHTAIREDASINMLAVENMKKKFPDLDSVSYTHLTLPTTVIV